MAKQGRTMESSVGCETGYKSEGQRENSDDETIKLWSRSDGLLWGHRDPDLIERDRGGRMKCSFFCFISERGQGQRTTQPICPSSANVQ